MSMENVCVFPGQGAQFSGMGKELYEQNAEAKMMFERANEILGFRITDIMFDGTAEELKQTRVTQPAVFLHSVVLAKVLGVEPLAVAGHSLGEFSALVVAGALSFEDGLKLVAKRAMAMQKACEMEQGTMAAVLALPDNTIEDICKSVDGVVVAANYNCPGQLVISGAVDAVNEACAKLKEAGARRALVLPVGGAFHSPLMEPARKELAEAIEDAFRMDRLVVAAASYDGGVFPVMHDFLHHLQIKSYQKRKVGIIENGSWAPCAARVMRSMLETMKDVEIVEPVVTIRSRMKQEDMPALEALADALLK